MLRHKKKPLSGLVLTQTPGWSPFFECHHLTSSNSFSPITSSELYPFNPGTFTVSHRSIDQVCSTCSMLLLPRFPLQESLILASSLNSMFPRFSQISSTTVDPESLGLAHGGILSSPLFPPVSPLFKPRRSLTKASPYLQRGRSSTQVLPHQQGEKKCSCGEKENSPESWFSWQCVQVWIRRPRARVPLGF